MSGVQRPRRSELGQPLFGSREFRADGEGLLHLARVLDGCEIGERLLQQAKRGSDLRGGHFDFAKCMICEAVYQLTCLDFGAGFVVVPDLPDAGGHCVFHH